MDAYYPIKFVGFFLFVTGIFINKWQVASVGLLMVAW